MGRHRLGHPGYPYHLQLLPSCFSFFSPDTRILYNLTAHRHLASLDTAPSCTNTYSPYLGDIVFSILPVLLKPQVSILSAEMDLKSELTKERSQVRL